MEKAFTWLSLLSSASIPYNPCLHWTLSLHNTRTLWEDAVAFPESVFVNRIV